MRVLMIGCAAGAGELDATIRQRTLDLACARLDDARLRAAEQSVAHRLQRLSRQLPRVVVDLARLRTRARASMPMTRLPLNFDRSTNIWRNSFTSAEKVCGENSERRNTRRRSTWKSSMISRRSSIRFFPLYLQFMSGSPMKFENLSKGNFFLGIGRKCRNGWLFFLANRRQELSRSVCACFAATRFTTKSSASTMMRARSSPVFLHDARRDSGGRSITNCAST